MSWNIESWCTLQSIKRYERYGSINIAFANNMYSDSLYSFKRNIPFFPRSDFTPQEININILKNQFVPLKGI